MDSCASDICVIDVKKRSLYCRVPQSAPTTPALLQTASLLLKTLLLWPVGLLLSDLAIFYYQVMHPARGGTSSQTVGLVQVLGLVIMIAGLWMFSNWIRGLVGHPSKIPLERSSKSMGQWMTAGGVFYLLGTF